jgi:hypothetical protein
MKPEQFIMCPECSGNGVVYEMISCGRSMSDCCGGCTRDVKCENCDGGGVIENEDFFYYEQ